MPGGWGDFFWGPDPWDGFVIETPVVTGLILYWDDDDADERLGPELCTRGERFPFSNEPPGHGLCWLVPEFMCVEDLDVNFGGTGDWHKILAVIYDWLFGARNITGFVDDIASFACIYDVERAPDNFLDALLQHLGFNLTIPLTTSEKRKVIKLLVDLYKRKGTAPGIESALRILLGIPAVVFPGPGVRISEGFEAGEDMSTTLSPVTSGLNYVEVDRPEWFEVGRDITIVDRTAPYQQFDDTPITAVVGNRVYFASQTLANTIEAGAHVWCNRYSDQACKVGFPATEYCEVGLNIFSTDDPGLYTFFVDIQKTVETVGDLIDGAVDAELTDVSFVVPGKRVRLTDVVSPLQPAVVVTAKEVDYDLNTFTFDPVALTETVEAGAEAINLFNADEIELIRRVVEFAKTSHTHFILTRDDGEGEAEVG